MAKIATVDIVLSTVLLCVFCFGELPIRVHVFVHCLLLNQQQQPPFLTQFVTFNRPPGYLQILHNQ